MSMDMAPLARKPAEVRTDSQPPYLLLYLPLDQSTLPLCDFLYPFVTFCLGYLPHSAADPVIMHNASSKSNDRTERMGTGIASFSISTCLQPSSTLVKNHILSEMVGQGVWKQNLP